MAHTGTENIPRWTAQHRASKGHIGLLANSNGQYLSNTQITGYSRIGGMGHGLIKALDAIGIGQYGTACHFLNGIETATGAYLTNNESFAWGGSVGTSRYTTAAAYFASNDDFRASAANGSNIYALHNYGVGGGGTLYYGSNNIVAPNAGVALATTGGILIDGTTEADTINGLKQSHALRSHHWVSNSSRLGGSVRPSIRNSVAALLGQSALVTLAAATPTSMQRIEVTAAAAQRSGTTWASFTTTNGTAISGNVILGPQQLCSTTLTAGVALTPFISRGSTSVYDWAKSHVDNITDAMIDQHIAYYVAEALASGQAPLLTLWFNDAFNFRGVTQTSLGPGAYTDGDSPEAYADNLYYVVNRWRQRWIAAGYDTARFWIVCHGDHPLNGDGVGTEDAELLAYRSTGYNMIQTYWPSQTFCVDGNQLATYAEMIAAPHYDAITNETTRLHLEYTPFGFGYPFYCGRLANWLQSVETAANIAAANASGTRFPRFV